MREIKILYSKGPNGTIEFEGVSVNAEAFEDMVGCPITLEGEVVGEVQSVEIVEAGVEVIGTIKEVRRSQD